MIKYAPNTPFADTITPPRVFKRRRTHSELLARNAHDQLFIWS
jgi:hypothetical protein